MSDAAAADEGYALGLGPDRPAPAGILTFSGFITDPMERRLIAVVQSGRGRGGFTPIATIG